MLRSLLVILVLPFAMVASAPPQDDAREAFLSLVARDYGKAIELLASELRAREESADTKVQASAERALYLLANARLVSGDAAGAAKDFERHRTRFPESRHAALARFGLARAKARGGDWRGAAEAYGAEVRRLLSPERRVRLSESYTGLAQKRLAQQPADLKGAISFLDLAVALELPRKNEIEIRRQAAALAFRAQDWGQAAQRYEHLIKMRRGSGVGVKDGIALEDRLALARAWRRGNQNAQARRLLEDLLREGLTGDARALARFELARTWNLPRGGNDGLRGVDELRRFLADHSESEYAPQATWLLVQTLEALGRNDEALRVADRLIADYADRVTTDPKRDELAQAAAERFVLLGRLQRYEDAITAAKDYLARFPAHGRWVEAQQAIVNFELGRADALRERGVESYEAAADLYYAWIAAHPLDPRAAAVSLRLGVMAEQQKEWQLARERFERTAAKYPNSREASEGMYRIGRLYENELFDYAKALEAYGKVTGSFAAQARVRISALREKSLVLQTERIFRTDEKPVVKLLTRNIEKLRVRVYRLDFETFFRGTRGTGDVSALAVEVIAPDESFDTITAEYAPYRETERQLDIPAKGAGAWVVKVDDGELEATTLVFVSDLGLITKSAREELFVFTQDTRTQVAVQGAKIVVSDGESVVAEGISDARGAWRYRGDATKGRRLFVFATTAGGSGATTMDLTSLRKGQGLQARAAIWSDRPLYAPGETIRAKAVLREVDAGSYRVPPKARHRFDCLDASGRLLASRELESDEFGTLLASFDVPDAVSPGVFALRVMRLSDRRILATERVSVERFTKPRVSLEVMSEQTTLVRGEQIAGKVTARWFFGGPVAGRRVEVRANVDGPRILEGKTDAAGEFRFSFDTTRLPNETQVAVTAVLAAENASATQVFRVRDRAYTLALTLPSSIFVAGDDLEARAVVQSHDEKPLARDLLFSLYKIESSPKGTSERSKGEVEVTSATADGVATARFVLDGGGGNWRLRVSGKDRLGQTIEASQTFFVSGKEDAVKLRVLSSAQYGVVGKTAQLRIVNRAAARLALITLEGDGVLEFETRALALGETAIELPFRPIHAPNFAWSIALMGDKALHTARKEFVVNRPLRVEVRRRNDAPLRPGGEIPLEIRAMDGAGQPVEAEFSLALVDQALLDVRADTRPTLDAIFWGGSVRRWTKLVTQGSANFAYRAETRGVNADLKAEETRKNREELEERAKAEWQGDMSIGRGLLESKSKDAARFANVADSMPDRSSESFNRAIGIGGGAGGKFGGRAGRGVANRGPTTGAAAQLGQVLDLNPFHGQLGLIAADKLGDADGDLRQAEFYFRQIQGNNALALGNRSFFADAVATEEPSRVLQGASSIWIGRVRCDASGRAEVAVRLPRREGAWRLRARGLTKDSLFGESTSEYEITRELLLEPVVPGLLLEGDVVHARLGVHWLGDAAATVSWQVRIGDDTLQDGSKLLASGSEARAEFDVPTESSGTQRIVYEAEAETGARDTIEGGVEIAPRALQERVARSGLLAGATRLRMALPAGDYRSRSLVLEFGPELPSELFPSAPLTRRFRLSCGLDWVAPTHGNRAAAGLAALAILEGWKSAAPEQRGAIEQLRTSVETTISEVGAFAENGQLAWIGRVKNNVVDERAGALATLFLVRAQKAGFLVDRGLLDAMRARVVQETKSRDLDRATLALLAIAEDGRGDFARFNALARVRSRMSLGAKARLALAAYAMGRPGLASALDIATEVAPRLAASKKVDAKQLRETLWALLAVRKSKSRPALVTKGIEWLWSQRTPWGFADALATALGSELYIGQQQGGDRLAARVDIEVGSFTKSIDLRAKPEHQRIVVPADALGDGEVVVSLETSGRGRVVYSALLEGVTKGLPKQRLGSRGLTRRYVQPAPILDGKPLPVGFGSVDRTVERWRDLATEVAVGARLEAELDWYPTSELRARFGSVVVEEPLPAGVQVRREDVSGNFDDLEIGRGFLRFYLHGQRRSLRVRYPLRGVVAGEYGVLPPRVFSLDAPAMQAYGKPALLRVLRDGESPRDVQRPTPDEMLARGVRIFDSIFSEGADPDALVKNAERRDVAEKWLGQLWSRYRENLTDKAFRDVARRLLRIALAKKDAASTVSLFEALRDRDPDTVLTFEDTESVADAYYRSGEFERALQVREAICETAFLREVQIAGTLEQIGEVEASIGFMSQLFQNFPGLPPIRGALYSLAQSLNERAESTPADAPGKSLLRVGLRRRARDLCREYLWRYPNDADADEVTFTLASVALEAEQVDEATALLERAREAYVDSVWLDDFVYLSGYAAFLRGDGEQALQLLERVATEEFPTGVRATRGPSESKDLAIFLQGQIHHAAGRPAEALPKYVHVEKKYAEAKEAADYFRDKKLTLPEVQLLAPDQKARLKLVHRNLERVSIAVYKVDLMRLYLMRKSLSDVGSVQLFGIAPIFEKDFDLSGDPRFREVTHEVDLPLEGRGSWLVLARTGSKTSSGLMLRSSLRIDAQELPTEARIRVNVRKDGIVLPKATVKVVGDRDGRIRSGRTDLRGIFIADDVQGRATVLVQRGDDYAFYRGKVPLGATPVRGAAQRGKKMQQMQQREKGFNALEGNRIQNLELQQRARKQLESLYKNTQRGVDIRRAK